MSALGNSTKHPYSANNLTKENITPFPQGGGIMGELIRTFDWENSSLGPISEWPQSLRTAVDIVLQSPVPLVMLWGRDGIMIYNDAYSRFAGARHPFLLGSKVLEGWPEVADFNKNVMKHCLAGKTLSYKDQILTLYRNNIAEQVSMDLNYSPIPNENGKPAGVLAIVIETTQRVHAEQCQKTAEKALQEERDRLHRLFMQAPAIIAIQSGPKHVFELVNPLYQQLLPHRNLLGKSYREAVPELEGQGYFETIDTVYQTGQPFEAKESPAKLDRGNGKLEVRYFNFVFQPTYNANGEIDGILTHAVEVTEQVENRKKIEELSKQKDHFMGIASHELKTPVTSIKAYTQVLQNTFKRKCDFRSVELLTKMDGQINKLSTLISDLLDVTKIEAGKIQFRNDYFAFNELVFEIIEEVQRTADHHRIIPHLTRSKTVYGDRDRTGQVITNFLTNAIKYSPNSDKIIVTTETHEKSIKLSVQDFGQGISKLKQKHVFERFYRVAGAKEDTYPGLGLGLYISSEMIKRQGGEIGVESKRGAGSTFYFILPLGK